jgi:hypothetical protein
MQENPPDFPQNMLTMRPAQSSQGDAGRVLWNVRR